MANKPEKEKLIVFQTDIEESLANDFDELVAQANYRNRASQLKLMVVESVATAKKEILKRKAI